MPRFNYVPGFGGRYTSFGNRHPVEAWDDGAVADIATHLILKQLFPGFLSPLVGPLLLSGLSGGGIKDASPKARRRRYL